MQEKAKFLSTSNQIDTYYQPSYRKFITDDKNINEWLRIGIKRKQKNFKL